MIFILEYPGKVLEFGFPFSVGTLTGSGRYSGILVFCIRILVFLFW